MATTNGLDELVSFAARLEGVSTAALVAADPARAAGFAVRAGPVYANFARQRYDRAALEALFAVAESVGAEERLRALFSGEPVNATEGRAALHTALRGDLTGTESGRQAHAMAQEVRERMRALIDGLAVSQVTDIVSVGIGGSDLGPRLVVDALAPVVGGRFRVHFLSNVDGAAAQRVLAQLDPARTAVLLISKTFGTQETLLNGAILRAWLGDDRRLYAITANPPRATAAFDIPPERVLPMWDWVGGRYSLWSAVGFPIALAIGMDQFEALLGGAAGMDAHVLLTPLRENLAVWHAMTAVWNRNALKLSTQAVLPYDERLKLLPNYLQQLVMESLGKSVRLDGSPVAVDTVPVWWGGAGTDSQHSFFQALHQGTNVEPLDFIGIARPDHDHPGNHLALLANLFAQSEAFANGQSSEDPHRSYAGQRPSTLILLDELTPQSLGALIAMYEHSVYLQGLVWGINPFDQFGVELGKQVANRLLPALEGRHAAEDPVTAALIAEWRERASLSR
ncbi:glucose-6-phosphate isomerase [Lysobacter daejeonensis GH1-9]|uniref:Glucose-6-phosphate isomerase n=1 Tax=Lysobacter daejeonensis GH1-9 TaxID=1385517 RepID=A0A0A0EZ65_9GAMM|nr:glucose-6-phosphate isomerase [Lysobacter daejeonensis]KGM55600.1 glucose-6-phosphate isomerase [Lysobacter daejeonensis GH1-9]